MNRTRRRTRIWCRTALVTVAVQIGWSFSFPVAAHAVICSADGFGCALAGSCVITGTWDVGNQCVLDFGGASPEIRGTLRVVDGGSFELRAADVTLAGGKLTATGSSLNDAGEIAVLASGRFEMRGAGPKVDASAEAGGGVVSIRAAEILLGSGSITVAGGSGNGCGDGGLVTLDAAAGIASIGAVVRASTPEGPCFGGSIEVNGQSVAVSAELDARGGGLASDEAIAVTALSGDVVLFGGAKLRADGTGQSEGEGAGGGGITIEAVQGNVLAGGTALSATGQSPGGAGGSLEIWASGRVELTARSTFGGGSSASGGRIVVTGNDGVTVQGDVLATGGSSESESPGGFVELQSRGNLLVDALLDVSGSSGGVVTARAAETTSLLGTLRSRGTHFHGGRVELAGCSTYISGQIDVRGTGGVPPGSYALSGTAVEVSSSGRLLASPCTAQCATVSAESSTISPSAVLDPSPDLLPSSTVCGS